MAAFDVGCPAGGSGNVAASPLKATVPSAVFLRKFLLSMLLWYLMILSGLKIQFAF